ncbi:MAG: Nif11-like leader peptide family natural product precursor [Gammaproteobacteria bacterium]|nr:Nif11-like leader peptide family natural product precursor [Gammaproteobacteria bacterium]
MSKESLEQFIQKVADSNKLQTRIGQRIDVESLIVLGAEHGCEFTAEDLADNAELSDEELDGVAGGAYEVLFPVALPSSLSFCSLEVDLSPIVIEGLKYPHPHRREFKDRTT